MPSFARSAAAALSFWLLISGCAGGTTVPRRSGNQESNGREISALAYAWYLRGQHLEALGDSEEAEYAYEQTLREDRASGRAWAALASLHCKRRDPKTETTFNDGLARASEKAPVYVARSRCAQLGDEHAQAIRFAQRALAEDPTLPEATLALADAHLARGDARTAQTILNAYEAFAGHKARPKSSELSPEHRLLSASETLTRVDRALRESNLEHARRVAAGIISPGELAVRAALLGKPELALVQADFALLLDADDPDAQVAWFICHRPSLQPKPALPRALALTALKEPSSLAVLAYTEYLLYSVGRQAALLFVRHFHLSKSLDPLLESARARLERSLKLQQNEWQPAARSGS